MNLLEALDKTENDSVIKYKAKSDWDSFWYIVQGTMLPFKSSHLLVVRSGDSTNQYASTMADLNWDYMENVPWEMVEYLDYEIIPVGQMLEEIKKRWQQMCEDGR